MVLNCARVNPALAMGVASPSLMNRSSSLKTRMSSCGGGGTSRAVPGRVSPIQFACGKNPRVPACFRARPPLTAHWPREFGEGKVASLRLVAPRHIVGLGHIGRHRGHPQPVCPVPRRLQMGGVRSAAIACPQSGCRALLPSAPTRRAGRQGRSS